MCVQGFFCLRGFSLSGRFRMINDEAHYYAINSTHRRMAILLKNKLGALLQLWGLFIAYTRLANATFKGFFRFQRLAEMSHQMVHIADEKMLRPNTPF